MKLLRAATLSVADAGAAASRYRDFLDYRVVEDAPLTDDLAASWGAPACAGARTIVMEPASGADIYLRFVEAAPVPEFRPLRTFGWAAIEICVTDVLAAAERMARSPFAIIGPPREIPGLPAIHPMQVEGPDGEIVYLTQIKDDLPAYDLPRAASFIDRLFICVLACSDMKKSLAWFEDRIGLSAGREMEIEYTMLAKAFGTPKERLYTIATMVHGRDVFLELDQYPDMAGPRPGRAGALPPGVAMTTFKVPDFSRIKGPFLAPPRRRDGVAYKGAMAATLLAPDGARVEIVGDA